MGLTYLHVLVPFFFFYQALQQFVSLYITQLYASKYIKNNNKQTELIKKKLMRLLGNILWLVFGGLEAAIGYFTGALAIAITIVGIPWALQIFKIGVLCLWPFGSTVKDDPTQTSCLTLPLNVLWLIFGGLYSWLMHIIFGILLCITIVGIPFGKQHFKMARLALMPFGKIIEMDM